MKSYKHPQSIYEFCHYTDYLGAYYHTRKKIEGFNLDQFTEDTGFARANLWRLVEGKAALTDRSKIFHLCEYLNLERMERRYFEALVDFHNSSSGLEALDRLEVLIELLPPSYYGTFVGQFAIYPWWLTQVMREVVQMPEFDGSFMNYAKYFKQPVTPAEVKQAVEVLVKNGALEKVSRTEYRIQEEIPVFTMDQGNTDNEREFARKAVFALQCKQLEIVQNAASSFDVERCYMVNHTVSLDSEKLPELEKLVLNFRDQVQEFMRTHPSKDSNMVVQLNTSLVPLFEKDNLSQ